MEEEEIWLIKQSPRIIHKPRPPCSINTINQAIGLYSSPHSVDTLHFTCCLLIPSPYPIVRHVFRYSDTQCMIMGQRRRSWRTERAVKWSPSAPEENMQCNQSKSIFIIDQTLNLMVLNQSHTSHSEKFSNWHRLTRLLPVSLLHQPSFSSSYHTKCRSSFKLNGGGYHKNKRRDLSWILMDGRILRDSLMLDLPGQLAWELFAK